MTFICYPNCSTCAKARAWLNSNDIKYTERNIKEQNPTYEEIKLWHNLSGLELKKFFNTSGQSYRALNLKEKLAGLSVEEQLRLLSSDGMLVKRPILVDGDKVLIGFNQKQWEAALLGR